MSDPLASRTRDLRAEVLAELALTCIRTEYPHCSVSGSSGEPGRPTRPPPRATHPVFYGCYDWHSAVHSHWALVHLLKAHMSAEPGADEPGADEPGADEPGADASNVARVCAETAARITSGLEASFQPALLDVERSYLLAHPGFEAPYGWAWLLKLASEARDLAATASARRDASERRGGRAEASHPAAELSPALWSDALAGLEGVCAAKLINWQEQLGAPITGGQHCQSAFALGLLLDWAAHRGQLEADTLARAKRVASRLHSTGALIDFGAEPYGNDFLSPGLAHVDILGRVLSPRRFGAVTEPWRAQAARLEPVSCPNPSDGKLAHLVGLNLSRAWMLRSWASRLGGPEATPLSAAAARHRALGLRQCGLDSPRLNALVDAGAASARKLGAHSHLPYALSHWIGSFVLYQPGF